MALLTQFFKNKLPTSEEIEILAQEYEKARLARNEAQAILSLIEDELADVVDRFGFPVPKAEKSRRLTGINGSEITLTQGDVATVVTSRVEALKDALKANGQAKQFKKLFRPRISYEVVSEPATAGLKLPVRLLEKVSQMFREAISVRPKKAVLRVTVKEQKAA